MEIFKDIIYNKVNGSQYTGEAEIDPSHLILKAHFPGNPILPGVVLLQFVSVIVEKITEKKLKLTNTGNVKFVKPIIPEGKKLLKINVDCVIQNGSYAVSGTLYYENDLTGHFKNLLYKILD